MLVTDGLWNGSLKRVVKVDVPKYVGSRPREKTKF